MSSNGGNFENLIKRCKDHNIRVKLLSPSFIHLSFPSGYGRTAEVSREATKVVDDYICMEKMITDIMGSNIEQNKADTSYNTQLQHKEKVSKIFSELGTNEQIDFIIEMMESIKPFQTDFVNTVQVILKSWKGI